LTIEQSPGLVFQSTNRRRMALPGPGIVLECTERGALLRIRRDDLDLLHGIVPGISFHQLLHRASLDKAFAFLSELREKSSAFGWELKINLTRQVTTLFVGGIMRDNRLLIFGTRTRGALLAFSRYFLDSDLLRAVNQVIREHMGLAPTPGERESALHEELHCTNNKLVNLQRVLARKNASLKRVSAELQETRTGIHTSQNFLPICSCCKKIRDEQGIWNQVETYFKDRTGVQFTHSICPECHQSLYPGFRLEK
jgi:hypothetical protein